MEQEDKELLLKDLCARLPHRVKIDRYNHAYELVDVDIRRKLIYLLRDGTYVPYSLLQGDEIKPYLRPMSSMTEEEKRELQSFYPGSFGNQWLDVEKGEIDIFECGSTIKLYLNDSVEIVNWLNAHHFDYRGLIEKGLALPAPEGMYK